MTYRSILFFMILAFLSAWPAAAAPITDDGAQRLKALFEKRIEEQRALSGIQGAGQITYDGTVTVEKADGYYAVTLPYVRMIYPDGTKINIGILSINASEHTNPGQWKMTVALPTPMTMMDGKGASIGQISIGSQRASGIWDEALGNFIKLDSAYQTIKISGEREPFELLIGEAQTRYDFTKDAANLWSGPGFFTMKDFDLGFVNDPTKTHIDEARLDFTLDKYSPAAFQHYHDALAAFAQAENKTKAGKDAPNPEDTARLYNILHEFLLTGMNGLKTSYSVEGLSVSTLIDSSSRNVALKKASLTLDLDGFSSGQLQVGWRTGYEGLTYTPMPKGYDVFLPTSATVNIQAVRIPVKDLTTLAKNTMQTGMQSPEMRQLAGLSLMMQIPALLAQAQTAATIDNSFAENGTYRLNLNGKIQADPQSISGFTAEATTALRGLDSLLGQAKALAADPSAEVAQDYTAIASSLEKLKGYAKIDNGGDSGTLYVFELLLDGQGQILLNGQNINDLFMPAPTAATPDTAPATPAPSANTAPAH